MTKPIASPLQRAILDNHPDTRQVGDRVVDVVLRFKAIGVSRPERAAADQPTVTASMEGVEPKLMVHWEATARPRTGEIWICEVDQAGWVWPDLKVGVID